jgi:hypothetical protein
VQSAAQGVVLKQTAEDLQNNKTTATTSYVEPDRVAVNTTAGDRQMTMVYLADANTMRMIDHSNKTVREMSGEDLEKMMGQVNEAMAKMREQMKNMPPQQREMMEKMMGDRMKSMMGGAPEKPVFKRGDGGAEIGGRSCDWYEGYRGEALFSMVCAAEWDSLGLQASDFAVFQKMAELMTKMAPGIADLARTGTANWQEQKMFPGFPLEQTIYMDGKPRTKSTLESVERGEIDGAVFEAPSNYKVEKGVPGVR